MKRSRLVLACLISLVALSSVGVATSLAWYQGATHLGVSSLDIELAGDNDLLLSTSPEFATFKNKLSTSDLPEVDAFIPVSTMFSSKWHDGKNLPEFYEYGSLTHVSEDGIPSSPFKKTEGFFSETLYMWSDRNVYVGLDPTNCFVRAHEIANAATAKKIAGNLDKTEEEVTARLNSLEKAMRFSLYDVETGAYYIFDPHKEGPTYYAGVLDMMGTGSYDTYASHNGSHYEILYGEVNDRSLVRHGASYSAYQAYEGELTSFNSGHESGAYVYDEEASFAAGLTYVEEPSRELTEEYGDIDIDVNPLVLALPANKAKPIVLSIYIEGWDRDCVNANMGASFLTQIQFKTLREMIL